MTDTNTNTTTISDLIKKKQQEKKAKIEVKSFSLKSNLVEDLNKVKKETGLTASELVNLAIENMLISYSWTKEA